MSNKKLVSVIIRTLNEEIHLEELLSVIGSQNKTIFDIETIIIDSGSTDRTLEIAKKHNCRVTHIDKKDFTFGRSLNKGCEFSNGSFLIFISGHCIPYDNYWINNLVVPLENECVYTYGRQIGRDTTKFSERQLFHKYFPVKSSIPQEGFFCNNANSAIRRDIWEKYQFDEGLTGCEDMFLGKQLTEAGFFLGYVAEASIFHIHNETMSQVKIRYEREAIALQKILPQVHLTIWDMIRYFTIGLVKDAKAALLEKCFIRELQSIVLFRWVQYYGAYKGNHIHRKLSRQMKMKYFYPRVTDMDISVRHNQKGFSDGK